MEKKRTLKVPHVYVIIVVLILLSAVLTYVIPAGAYDFVYDEAADREVVVADSFRYLDENTPASFRDLITSVSKGMAASVDIMMLVVLVCASFQIINDTGALSAGIFALLRVLKGRNKLVLVIMTVIYSAIGGYLGWLEGQLIFIPITVAMAVAMGYDNALGFMVLAFGAISGYATGPLNVYSTGVCQGIMGLPLYSGFGFRVVAWVLFTILACIFVLAYARRIEKDPTKSLTYGAEGVIVPDVGEAPAFNTRRRLVFLVTLVGIVVSAIGCASWGWYLQELTGIFILTGIVGGLVYGMSGTQMSNSFAAGAREIIPSALVIGASRAILVLLEEADVLHTVINGLAQVIGVLPHSLSGAAICGTTALLDALVTSASAKAAIMMPSLAPLGDILGISGQVTIVAFQLGDGFTNFFWPTSGVLMAGLAMSGNIPWDRWAKYAWKFAVASVALAMVVVFVGQMIGIQ